LRRLTNILRKLLESSLAEHCYVGNIEQDTLVILADTAARASKLRFHTTQLLEALPATDTAFSGIKFIKVKVLNQHSELSAPQSEAQTGPKMNEENADYIRTLADSVDDEPLHNALLRLARNARRKQNT